MMRKFAQYFFVVSFLSLVFFLLTPKTNAGDLGAFVKIDRLAPSKNVGGTICAIPETIGTENSIQVIFPTGFNVNQTASNWTINTSDLPSGAVALPGINTASNVSGQIVTFPSDDLTVGTQYCFNFVSSNTLTTPPTTGSYVGTLRTRNASNTTIDTREYAISIITNDQISVTGTVAANPTDFEAGLVLTHPANNTFPQSTELTYTLTYGSLLTNSTGIIVQAQWDLGTIQGSGTPTEDILDYVMGSATDAYNSTPPVIDSFNRTISWTLLPIPANTTGQTVSFKLLTNSAYTGTLPVTFTVNGRVLGPGTQTADSTVTSNYKYNPPPTPAGPGDGRSDGRTDGRTDGKSSITSTTPSTNYLRFTDIEVRTVNSSEAAIFVATDNKTRLKISYATSMSSLNQLVADPEFTNQHLVSLNKLKPNSRYYFKVTVTDINGHSITSDLYLIDTARLSVPPQALTDSLIVTSGDVVLTDPLRLRGGITKIAIPSNTPYAFKFVLSDYENVKSVKAVLRNDQVLGLSSTDISSSTDSLQVTEISPGQYIGKLKSNEKIGNYRLILQIQDYYGNISEQTMTLFYVVEPLRVVDATDNTGIENAKVTYYYLNQRLKIYELLSSAITPIKNPNFSEADGRIWTVLPEGQYRAEVKALGFETKNIDFEIKAGTSSFPTVKLNHLPFNLITYAQYSVSTAYDVFGLLQTYIHTLRTSIRFFELVALVILAFFVFLTAFSTARRLSVPMYLLPYFAYYHFILLFQKPKHDFAVHGKVTIAIGGEVVPGALVYISMPNSKVIAHIKTNSYGEFFTNIREACDIRILVNKKGFKASNIRIDKKDINDNLSIELDQTQKPPTFSLQILSWYIFFILDSLFEAILIITLIVELLFMLEFGWLKVTPFIIVSLFNIVLWAANVRANRQ